MRDYLLIDQIQFGQVVRTITLSPNKKGYSLGASQFSDIFVADPKVDDIHGYFQFNENRWQYFDLSTSLLTLGLSNNEKSEMQTEVLLSDLKNAAKLIQISESCTLRVNACKKSPISANAFYENLNLNSEEYSRQKLKKPADLFHLFVLSFENKVIETRLVPNLSKNLQIGGFGIAKLEYSTDWKSEEKDGIVLRYKIVSLNPEIAESFKNDVSTNKQIKYFSGILMGLLGLFILGHKFLPASSVTSENITAKSEYPKELATQVRITRPEPKTKKAKSAEVVKVAEAKIPTQHTNESTSSHLKLKQMMQKIGQKKTPGLGQGQNRNTQNPQGAGTPLVAIGSQLGGSQNGKGSEWSNESSKGAPTKISTIGNVGGDRLANYGKISQGKAGNSGVGLIDEESEISGGLDKEVIAQYIKSQLGQILFCYERQLSATPDLFGKLAVKFIIDPKGGVESQKINESTIKNAFLEGCVLQRIKNWKFPVPEGGTKVIVTYPFMFKSTN